MNARTTRRALAAGALTATLILSASSALAAPSSARAAEARPPAPGKVAVDVAAEAGIAALDTRTWGAAPYDYDGDGAEDVLIGYHSPKKLWRNEGAGAYAVVPQGDWPSNGVDRHDCAWGDVDGNGRPDLYCAAGRGSKNKVKNELQDNELWLQGADGTFTEVGTAWGVGDLCGRGRAVAFLHANGDAWLDLFVGNMAPRKRVANDPCDGSPRSRSEGSKVFLNEGGTGFRFAPRFSSFAPATGSQCVEVLDFNRDGRDDLFTCRNLRQQPSLYVNKRGVALREVTERHRLAAQINDADVTDLDADGDPDLVTAFEGGFAYQLNKRGVFSARTVISRVRNGTGKAVAVGDADGDGDLDVYGMVGGGSARNPDDRILLNSRLRFTGVRVPSATGAADEVVAVRRDAASPQVEFLALNGYNLQGKGPIQLIRLVPR